MTLSQKTRRGGASKRRRWLFVGLAMFLGLTLALTAIESVLRVYVASRGWTSNCYVTGLVFFVPHASAGYTLRPNLRLKSSTYDVTTNSLGCRGPEISRSKPADVRRIVVLGGSSVFGYLVPDGMDSCRQMQRLLDVEKKTRFEVVNAGVPGYNLYQCRLRFTEDLCQLKPDYVLLYLGWNDSKFVVAEDPTAAEMAPPAPALSERMLAKSMLFGLIRYRLFPPPAPKFSIPSGARSQVTQAGAARFDRELRDTIATIRACGAIPVFSTQIMAAHMDDADDEPSELDEYLGADAEQRMANRTVGIWITEKIRELAAEESVPLIDTATNVPSNSETLGDAIHPTEFGHQLVAEAWTAYFRSLPEQE